MTAPAEQKPHATVHQTLLRQLEEIDRPGDFCACGDWPFVVPGLEVDGVGTIGLPLTKTQARQLIRQCHQAPYGKGTETIVDTSVRRVWELDPDRFRLAGPNWRQCLDEIVAKVQTALGLEDCRLKAKLYKLLVYEKGSFFLPHQDGEKLDRMVATLVIEFPSVHEGGELVVSHGDESYEIFLGGAASGYDLGYAAFYADCEHEVLPVRSGYRLCLIYNLTLARTRGKKGISAPDYRAVTSNLAETLKAWERSADKADKLAMILGHEYTEPGLAPDILKGSDRARAGALFAAAERAECEAHLALVTLWEVGSAEGGADYRRYGRYGRRSWYVDEQKTTYEMGEIYDSSLTAEHWTDRNGNRIDFGKIDVDRHELVMEGELDDEDPSDEQFEGYTGNAGMTLERWYRRAAVVIWPKRNHFHVLCRAGTQAAVTGLEQMVASVGRAPKRQREELRRQGQEFASAIIDSWSDRPLFVSRDDARRRFPDLLAQLEADRELRRCLVEIMPSDPDVKIGKPFVQYLKTRGWLSFEQELNRLIGACEPETVIRNSELLRQLCTVKDKNSDRMVLCRRLLERHIDAILAWEKGEADDEWRFHSINRAELFRLLLTAMVAVGAEQLLSRWLDYTFEASKYDLTKVHLAAAFALKRQLAKALESSEAVRRWLERCREELERRTAEPPWAPADYRRPADWPCDCADCQMLALFLRDPDQATGRFRLAKHRRRHLHSMIDTYGLDCTHTTERRGSPYILVCEKTTGSHERDIATYKQDQKNLRRLRRLMGE